MLASRGHNDDRSVSLPKVTTTLSSWKKIRYDLLPFVGNFSNKHLSMPEQMQHKGGVVICSLALKMHTFFKCALWLEWFFLDWKFITQIYRNKLAFCPKLKTVSQNFWNWHFHENVKIKVKFLKNCNARPFKILFW